jgi:hypothetical protein
MEPSLKNGDTSFAHAQTFDFPFRYEGSGKMRHDKIYIEFVSVMLDDDHDPETGRGGGEDPHPPHFGDLKH